MFSFTQLAIRRNEYSASMIRQAYEVSPVLQYVPTYLHTRLMPLMF